MKGSFPESPGFSRQLTLDQKKTAQAAVTEMRKLTSAVEVGVSYVQYSNLVVQTKINTDPSIGQLPESRVKQALGLAMQMFAEARRLWGISFTDYKGEIRKLWSSAEDMLRLAQTELDKGG